MFIWTLSYFPEIIARDDTFVKLKERYQKSLAIHKLHFTFTFIHLADAFIQSDLQMKRTIQTI